MSYSDSFANISIRRAVLEDAAAIASLLQEAFMQYKPLYTPGGFAATSPTTDQIRARWDEGPVWVATQNEAIVGTVAAVAKSSGLYVRSMAVLPSARGQGIATSLLKEVERFAMHHAHTNLFLSTTPFLYDAIRLYKNFGFRKSEENTPDLFGTPLFTMIKMLNRKISLNEISIRTELKPGDLGYIIHLHGALYAREYGYGVQFESYVAQGLSEFYEKYNPKRNRVWVCEHDGCMIGFLLLMDRGQAAQLRYFLIEPEYRGIGLGSKLLNLYMDFLRECGYKESYLWTTHELSIAASLYRRHGFELTEEKESTAFGKPLREQRYNLILP